MERKYRLVSTKKIVRALRALRQEKQYDSKDSELWNEFNFRINEEINNPLSWAKK